MLDENIPVGVRRFLLQYEVRTGAEMGWPNQLENGALLNAAKAAGCDVMVADQNIRYQQNLKSRKLALVVLGSNIWPLVRECGGAISATVNRATSGSYHFIEMPLPPKPQRN